MEMERFWDRICTVTPLWRSLLAGAIVLLLLSGFSMVFVDPGSGSYYILVFNLVVLSGLVAANVFVLRRCSNRANRRQMKRVGAEDDRDEG